MNNHTNKIRDSFFIYDYETFGKNPAIDRPAQFAGIRTDYQFNPLNDPEVFFCRLPIDYLPNPESVVLTEINPMRALKNGLKEYQFADRIQKIFNVPKTCILGYNNIRFDNEFTRNIFYRNFYDPYSWSWKQGNSNLDLLYIIRAFYVLRPEGIIWPIKNNGTPSFRLKDLTKSNNIKHEKAHDALSDIYATLQLAKFIQSIQPKLFEYLYHYRKKNKLKKLINLTIMKPLIYVPTNILSNNNQAIWISPLAWHPKNENILIACNLNTDLNPLWTTNIKKLKQQFLTSSPYNQETILQLIHINKCPILIPIQSLRTQDITRLNINPKHCLNNLNKLKKYIIKTKNTITSIYNDDNRLNTKYKKLHVDNQLYTKFFHKSDQYIMQIIRNTSPKNLSKLKINSLDDRLEPLFFFYKARNFPNTLNHNEKKSWLKYRQTLFTKKILINYTKQLNDLFKLHTNQDKKIEILHSLMTYLKHIEETLKI